MVKHNKEDNPYAVAHSSSSKRCKYEYSDRAHVLEIVPVKGHMFDVITSKRVSKPHLDAFMPFLYHLVSGDKVTNKNGEEIKKELLDELGIKKWYYLRGPDGGRVASGDNDAFHRQVLLKTNSPEQIGQGRTARDMLNDLELLTGFTKEVADAVDTKGYPTVYRAAQEVKAVRNPKDGKIVSLDHYLIDDSVVEVMKNHLDESILTKNFVKNYFHVACAYFNPYRTDLPASVRCYGFPVGSSLSEMGDCKKMTRVDITDLEEFP